MRAVAVTLEPMKRTLLACAMLLNLIALCALSVGPAGIAWARSHGVSGHPRIVIRSPQPDIYPADSKLLAKFSCTSPSGIASCTAKLTGAGSRARRVISGTLLRPAKTGRYTLRVTARDGRGRSSTAATQFLVERTVSWSGYVWFVRHAGWGGPGANVWSDSTSNARISGSDLVLSVVRDKLGRWTSSEIDNARHLGYGTYRWVVASDLSDDDPNQVLGMFIFGGTGPLADEIDIEPSRWGNPLAPNGSVAVWQSSQTHASQFNTFTYSNHPPYVNQFTWSPGRVSFLITDAMGAVLLDWTAIGGVPAPSNEAPGINYWRFGNVAPSATTAVRISSFKWMPLAR